MLIDKARKTYMYYSRYQHTDYYYDTAYDRYFMGKSQWLDDDTPYLQYIVQRNDTYDSLALDFYNNPTYWWIIADFNRVKNPWRNPIAGQVIKIPIFSNLEFKE